MKPQRTDATVVLVVYQIIYVVLMLWVLPALALSETLNALFTAILTVTSAVLIGRTFFKERENNNVRGSLGLLSLCTLITVYVLYQCGIYS